jgi:SAM-dependent methyltransferase
LSTPENFFGEGIAERYDESHSEMFASSIVGPAVDFLAGVAGKGAALELGIGTGRIALPLARRGVRVHGIELSEAMVQQLRAKPGGNDVEVTIGDFATTTVEGAFSVAYLVFNTINNLTSQDAQVACFQNVATHLEPGGCFVIEVGVPSLRRLPYGKTFNAFHLSDAYVGINEYDVANQGLVSHHRREARAILGFSWGFSIREAAISLTPLIRLAPLEWDKHHPLLRREHPAWAFATGYRNH